MQKQFVIPDWMSNLTFQQQSVLMLALRGPDGVRKHHPMKNIQRAYRGTILKAAVYGRLLGPGEEADSFMSMERIADITLWQEDMRAYFHHIDELPHHFHAHLMHGAQILGYKHESFVLRSRWYEFYHRCVDDAHLNIETHEEMDERLSDWGRVHWDLVDLSEEPKAPELKPATPTHEQFPVARDPIDIANVPTLVTGKDGQLHSTTLAKIWPHEYPAPEPGEHQEVLDALEAHNTGESE